VRPYPRSRTAPFTEDDWTVAEAPGVGAYTRSKTLFALFDLASRLVLPELGRLIALDNHRTRLAGDDARSQVISGSGVGHRQVPARSAPWRRLKHRDVPCIETAPVQRSHRRTPKVTR